MHCKRLAKIAVVVRGTPWDASPRK